MRRRGRHRRGHGGHRRNWYGPVTYSYPYYGYPYYDDFRWQQPQTQMPVLVMNRDANGSGINWPTIAISMALSALLLMRK